MLLLLSGVIGYAQAAPYVIDPLSKKQLTYTVSSEGNNQYKVVFEDGKVSRISIEDLDFNKAYAKATIPPVPPAPAAPVVSTSGFTEMGEGFGTIALGDIANKKIKIKPGSYRNITVSKAKNIVIDARGVTLPGGTLDIFNVAGVEIYGLSIIDQTYRAVNIRGFCTGIYLHDMLFKNIANNVITYEYSGLWDKTDSTTSKDWKFEHLTFINTATAVALGGGFDDAGIKTMMLNFRFLNNTIKDCPYIGNVVYCSAADNYEIAGNVIDRINTKYDPKNANGIHNGIFMMVGNGSLHDNKCTNHQGNLIRAWGISFGGSMKNILIYNNKVYNSWKYSAFELQVPPFLQDYKKKYPRRISFTNAKVYQNTAGHLNVSKDWEGQLLDLYNTFGTVEVKNNLGFNMIGSRPNFNPVQDSMINGMYGVETKLVLGTNRYFKTQAEAVSNTTALKSLIAGIGAK